MVLTALRGALGFLTRLPVGRDERAWDAFRATPAAFPLVGFLVGGLAAAPFALPALPLLQALPAPTVAVAFAVAVYAVTGLNHADGVADLGDAAAVHGDPAARRAVLKDSQVGVGALLSLSLVVAALALAGLALASLPPTAAVSLAVAAEVGAKLGMAALACLGSPAHEGFGSAFTDNRPTDLLAAVVAAAPVALLGASAVAALAGAVLAALAVRRWARTRLGGVSGDAFGAANELGRVVGLHAGVVAWTLS